ncbi:hypothetical protein C8Q77DRAFT_1275441 [Trametes polyzona]|nr:hypothetical protein C8Q77DRAFT_1275441 [Trametes polyzona]
MRLSLVFCAAALVNTALAAVLVNSSDSAAVWRRGLDGILDGFHDQDQTTTHDRAAVTTDAVSASTTSPAGDAALKSLLGISSSLADLTSTKTKNKESSAAATGTSYSVIGSLPPINPPSAAHPNTIPPATPTSSTTLVLPTAAAAATESSASSGTSEWKIIGVAVIAFTTVAGILLLSVFFDQWWRFVRDLFGRQRKKETEEELVPDWEKAEWHLRCGRDRQRYPSFSSLPDIAKVQPPPPAAPGPSRNSDSERVLGQQSGTAAGLTGYPTEAHRDRVPSGIGLGIGRMDSVRREGSSPRGVAGRSPSVKRGKTAYENAMQNPFDDVHASPTLEDAYGGVAN